MQLNINVVGVERGLRLTVERCITVLQMKLYIEFTFNIPHKKQTLIYESTVIKDKHTLEYYDISDGDDVSLVIKAVATRMTVTIKSMIGSKIELPYEPFWSIEELKLHLQSKEGIPICDQRLIWHGRQLENTRTIEEYGLKNLDLIFLVLKLRGS